MTSILRSRRFHPFPASLLGVLGILLLGVVARAAEDAAVTAGREALQGRTRFPWYDAQQDAVRRIDVRPPKETAEHRGSTWQADPFPEPVSSPSFGWDWSGLRAVVQALLWSGLLGLLAWLIYFLIRSYLRQHSAVEAEEPPEPDRGGEQDMIESLPFEIARPQTDLLAEARRLYESGMYAQAVVYLFSYQLVRLDRSQQIRLARGKTNRQYLRELQPRPDLRGLLERTMVVFEEVFFGHYPLDRAGFERCWEGLDEFHQRLSEGVVSDG
jgi:hypothetical protein